LFEEHEVIRVKILYHIHIVKKREVGRGDQRGVLASLLVLEQGPKKSYLILERAEL
jgi:hypothetical protein